MSCNCSCACEGTWQTPAISLPIHAIRFESDNSMHCAQSAPPRHRLACNLPNLSRDKRSAYDMDSETIGDIPPMIYFSFTIILILTCVLLTYNNYMLRRSLNMKNSHHDEHRINNESP